MYNACRKRDDELRFQLNIDMCYLEVPIATVLLNICVIGIWKHCLGGQRGHYQGHAKVRMTSRNIRMQVGPSSWDMA